MTLSQLKQKNCLFALCYILEFPLQCHFNTYVLGIRCPAKYKGKILGAMENEVSALILNPHLSHQKDHVKEQYLSRDPATKL